MSTYIANLKLIKNKRLSDCVINFKLLNYFEFFNVDNITDVVFLGIVIVIYFIITYDIWD